MNRLVLEEFIVREGRNPAHGLLPKATIRLFLVRMSCIVSHSATPGNRSRSQSLQESPARIAPAPEEVRYSSSVVPRFELIKFNAGNKETKLSPVMENGSGVPVFKGQRIFLSWKQVSPFHHEIGYALTCSDTS